MRLKYKGASKGVKGSSPLVVAKHGYESWECGQIKEMEEYKGRELMDLYPGQFAIVADDKKKKPSEETKMKVTFKNKAK